jgi:hypothetical protein
MRTETFPEQLKETSASFYAIPSKPEDMPEANSHLTQLSQNLVLRPEREYILLLLAEIVASKGKDRVVDCSGLAKFKAGATPAVSDTAKQLIAKVFQKHGFLGTATLRLIEHARRCWQFQFEDFLVCRELDKDFWELLNGFGRVNQPERLFSVFTVYEAEKELGEPITSLAGYEAILCPQ